MIKLRNALLAALGIIVLNTVVVLYTTRNGHAAGGPVVVTVSGTASTEDVNNPDLQPVQFLLFPHSSTHGTATDTFVVPAHKRLVIQYIDGQAQDLTGGAALLTVSTLVNGSSQQYIVYVNKDDTNAVTEPVTIYADPGS